MESLAVYTLSQHAVAVQPLTTPHVRQFPHPHPHPLIIHISDKMRLILLAGIVLSASSLNNGRSVTPPMGWVRLFTLR